MNDNLMVALFFESKLIDSIFYGDVVFENIFKGNELAKNKNKIIVSSGDIFGDAYQDITPYIFNNDFCTITFEKNNKYKSFKDWPYCWILEDIEPDIAKSLDVRLKKEFKAYFGMSLIDVSSCDKKKQFWKSLPRMFSINKNVITVFGISECGFGYYKTALENNLEVVFVEVVYDDDEE
ncbi:MAG: hypothetical protein LBM99_04470 [Bacillales bacterium]|nr:hypothetical protein [Bacillales bacterium]